MTSTQVEINAYRDLKVWQAAFSVRRAAVSVPANIAEGGGRESSGAYVQALRVSQGSPKEFDTLALLAARVGLTTAAEVEPLLQQSGECSLA